MKHPQNDEAFAVDPVLKHVGRIENAQDRLPVFRPVSDRVTKCGLSPRSLDFSRRSRAMSLAMRGNRS